ncbi:MAG: preprotein translocase subunit SecE, partial [Pseudodesulfovibrio sp.]
MAKKKGKNAAEKQAEQTSQNALVLKVKEFIEFFEESKVEIKKVVWPTRKET